MKNHLAEKSPVSRAGAKPRAAVAGVILLALWLLLAGCPAATPPAAAKHTFSGQVFDALNGRPVYGAVVSYGSFDATSGADGSFTMELGEETGSMSASLSVRADGYFFTYFVSVTMNAGSDPHETIQLQPVDATAYVSHTLSGRIYDSTPTEIANTTPLTFTVLNSGGGMNTFSTTYSGGYSITVRAFGSDCLVAVLVGGASPFFVMSRQVDLSAASTTLNFTEDLAATTNVDVTGSQAGNKAQLTFATPYGRVPASVITLSGAASDPYAVTNPYGYQGTWQQTQVGAVDVPATGYRIVFTSTSPAAAIGPSETLPAVNLSLAPTAAPVVITLAYSAGTLSMTSVASANLYVFILVNQSTTALVGMILSPSETVSLPSWLSSRLAGKTYAVMVQTFGASSELDVASAAQVTIPGRFPLGVQLAQVQLISGSDAAAVSF